MTFSDTAKPATAIAVNGLRDDDRFAGEIETTIPLINVQAQQLRRIFALTDAVAEGFGGVSLMTPHRWINDQTPGFPVPIKIRSKNFCSRALEDFKARMMRNAINQRVEAK